MAIAIQQLTFHCRWTSEARVPNYLGSTLRGAFGWALKRCACMLKTLECQSCVLKEGCAYMYLFATEQYAEKENGGSINARPHPLVFQPDRKRIPAAREGENWSFSLLVFGKSNEFLHHIVYSVKMMGEAGIGAGSTRGMGRFKLEKVSANGLDIFDGITGHLRDEPQPTNLALGDMGVAVDRVGVYLRTPLRLKQENRLQTELPFHALIRTVLRRISALETAYGLEGKGEPMLDYRGLVKRAEEVRIKESTLRWNDLQRYSNRQQQKVSLSGLTGKIDYSGDITEFIPLLIYASKVHIGKQTLFGLGRMEISPGTEVCRRVS